MTLRAKKTNLHDPWPKDEETVFRDFLQSDIKSRFELISMWPLYDRQMFITGETRSLDFFNDTVSHPNASNLYLPGCLPAPQSFLLRQVMIEGISSDLRYGTCELIISSKLYSMMPAWTFGLKSRGYKLKYPLFIAPMTNFRFRIMWEQSIWLGIGVNGIPVLHRPLQVVFFGDLARPVQ